MKKKKGDWKNIISNTVLILAAGVFLYSGYMLYSTLWEYQEGRGEYKELQEIAITNNILSVGVEDLQEESSFAIDFIALQEINRDIIGWIRFEEPMKISYPVVQGADNDKYLGTTFEGKKNKVGTLFADYCNSKDFTDRNTFIYGHNMKDDSMFGELEKYKNRAFCEENPYFYVHTLDGKEITYKIFAVAIVGDASESYKKAFGSDEEFLQYIEYVKKISRFTTDVAIDSESKIVSLSTCTNVNEDERLLVHGVKVEEK